MLKADNEAVKQTILLSRRLCAVGWLTEQHADVRDTLQFLVSTEQVRAKLCIPHLSLWTLCSREISSSVISRTGSAHIVVDGFQLLALNRIFSAVVLSAELDVVAPVLLGLLAEVFLSANQLGMASLCKTVSIKLVKRNPKAFVNTRSQASVIESQHTLRMFLLGHELGHVMLDASPAERSVMREDLDARLKEVRAYLEETAPPDIKDQIGENLWSPAYGNYWDELCCDTLSVEILEHMKGMMGGRDRVQICEAIVATALGLDILRLFKRIVLKDDLPSESNLLTTLFNESYVRLLHLNRLVAIRFGVSQREMRSSMMRFQKVFSGDGVLWNLFSMLPELKKLVDSDGRDWKTAEQVFGVDSMFGWRASRDALIYEQIF